MDFKVSEARPVNNRFLLKAATQEAHALADARWGNASTFEDPARYKAWLERLQLVHARFGLRAASELGAADRAEEEARLDCLETDTGRSVVLSSAAGAPSQDWSWGVCYALNGSALGASIMLKTFDLESEENTHYMQHMGQFARSGKLADFFERLNRHTLSPEAAAAGARAVFDLMDQRCSESMPEASV